MRDAGSNTARYHMAQLVGVVATAFETRPGKIFINITKDDLSGGNDQNVKYDLGKSREIYLRLIQSVYIP